MMRMGMGGQHGNLVTRIGSGAIQMEWQALCQQGVHQGNAYHGRGRNPERAMGWRVKECGRGEEVREARKEGKIGLARRPNHRLREAATRLLTLHPVPSTAMRLIHSCADLASQQGWQGLFAGICHPFPAVQDVWSIRLQGHPTCSFMQLPVMLCLWLWTPAPLHTLKSLMTSFLSEHSDKGGRSR